jgi:hypothetical protein
MNVCIFFKVCKCKCETGTASVTFQTTIVKDAERVTIEGKSCIRDIFLQTITCMEGYSSKSTEELRYEDYYLKDADLMVIKKNLDNEVTDRGREAAACIHMAKEEKLMR